MTSTRSVTLTSKSSPKDGQITTIRIGGGALHLGGIDDKIMQHIRQAKMKRSGVRTPTHSHLKTMRITCKL